MAPSGPKPPVQTARDQATGRAQPWPMHGPQPPRVSHHLQALNATPTPQQFCVPRLSPREPREPKFPFSFSHVLLLCSNICFGSAPLPSSPALQPAESPAGKLPASQALRMDPVQTQNSALLKKNNIWQRCSSLAPSFERPQTDGIGSGLCGEQGLPLPLTPGAPSGPCEAEGIQPASRSHPMPAICILQTFWCHMH